MAQSINPNMIVLARESREFSQAELAKELDISQGALSRMESGDLRVSPEIVDKLAQILHYPKKYFFQTFEVYPLGMGFYRKHKTLSSKKQLKMLATMNIRREHIKKLLESADIEYKDVPERDVEEYGDPAEIARAVREYLRLPRGPVKNMTEVMEDMGIIVVPCDFGTRQFSGACIFTEKPNYVALVNSEMPGDRLRWTLAHELGHLVMHRMPTPNLEEEANSFASEFLMPAQEIGQYLSKLSLPTLANLKKYWKVSMAAILVHAHRLKKISEKQYRTLWTEMGKAGYRMQEPPELDIPKEEPTLLKELVDMHIGELGYTPEELSDKLAFDEDEFKTLYLPQNKRFKLLQKKVG